MEENIERICKLNSGAMKNYDAVGNNPFAYDKKYFKYLGMGFIYKIDNIEQGFTIDDQQSFFIYR